MKTLKKLFCKRATNLDWSKIGLSDEARDLFSNYKSRKALFFARNGKNIALFALKKRDGITGTIPAASEEYYYTKAEKIMEEVMDCLRKAGYLRDDIRQENLLLLEKILRGSMLRCRHTSTGKFHSLIKDYYLWLYKENQEQADYAFEKDKKIIEEIIKKLTKVTCIGQIGNTLYETYDFDKANRQIADILESFFSPMQLETLKWWFADHSEVRCYISDIEKELLDYAYYNIIVKASFLKNKFSELF